jgi:hypothetical protein
MKIPARRGAKTKRPRFYLTLQFKGIYVKKRIRNEEKQQRNRQHFLFICQEKSIKHLIFFRVILSVYTENTFWYTYTQQLN